MKLLDSDLRLPCVYNCKYNIFLPTLLLILICNRERSYESEEVLPLGGTNIEKFLLRILSRCLFLRISKRY